MPFFAVELGNWPKLSVEHNLDLVLVQTFETYKAWIIFYLKNVKTYPLRPNTQFKNSKWVTLGAHSHAQWVYIRYNQKIHYHILTYQPESKRIMANNPSIAPSKHNVITAWVYAAILLLFYMYVFVFTPAELPEFKHNPLRIFSALLCALFIFFFISKLKANLKIKSKWAQTGIRSGSGAATFVLVLCLLNYPILTLAQRQNDTTEVKQGVQASKTKVGVIKDDSQTIVKSLQDELSAKNGQIASLQTQKPEMSAKAKELAKQIPDTADDYALALKAIAEERSDEAMQLLDKVQAQQKTEIANIDIAKGDIQYYQGSFAKAADWYQKALSLTPDDATLLIKTGMMFFYSGQSAQAEPLLQHSLAVNEKTFGKSNPAVATSLNNLAGLYKAKGQYAEAELTFQQSLAIFKKTLGKDHPDVAICMNNLALLYGSQGKYAEAEPLYQRSLAIREKAFGKAHPNVAQSLTNLAELYRTQGQYAKAEPLFQRSLAINEKAFGKDNPDVATSLNNLAFLYGSQGKYAKAEALFRRSLAINEKAFGENHPNTKAARDNLRQMQAYLPVN